jgi:hypothetical protein
VLLLLAHNSITTVCRLEQLHQLDAPNLCCTDMLMALDECS